TNETTNETTQPYKPRPNARPGFAYCLVRGGGGCGIRTREGLPPTRFPSVRPRPLGESSGGESTGRFTAPAALRRLPRGLGHQPCPPTAGRPFMGLAGAGAGGAEGGG